MQSMRIVTFFLVANSCMDIIYCLYAYYGALMYKQPQFSRWLATTVSGYSPESKKAMSIPR